jgi:glycosyltransferase involved in cell wall biosynthesis
MNSGDITVILTYYKRKDSILQVIESINNQTIKPKEIWLLHNFDDTVKEVIDENLIPKNVKIIKSSMNFNCYFRWAMVMLVKTKYAVTIDDDHILGKKWFENCLSLYEIYGNDIAAVGLGIKSILFKKENNGTVCEKYGYIAAQKGQFNQEPIEVMLGQQPLFFPVSIIRDFWGKTPFTLDAADDYHFSDTIKRANGKIYVTPHTQDIDTWAHTGLNPIDYDKDGNPIAKSVQAAWNKLKDDTSKLYLYEWDYPIKEIE